MERGLQLIILRSHQTISSLSTSEELLAIEEFIQDKIDAMRCEWMGKMKYEEFKIKPALV